MAWVASCSSESGSVKVVKDSQPMTVASADSCSVAYDHALSNSSLGLIVEGGDENKTLADCGLEWIEVWDAATCNVSQVMEVGTRPMPLGRTLGLSSALPLGQTGTEITFRAKDGKGAHVSWSDQPRCAQNVAAQFQISGVEIAEKVEPQSPAAAGGFGGIIGVGGFKLGGFGGLNTGGIVIKGGTGGIVIKGGTGGLNTGGIVIKGGTGGIVIKGGTGGIRHRRHQGWWFRWIWLDC